MKPSWWVWSSRTWVITGLGALLYWATSWIGIPITSTVELRPGIALLSVLGALFGPVVGFIAGFVGHAMNDLMMDGTVWWGWALGSGMTAAFMGLVFLYKDFDAHEGMMEKRHLIRFVLYGTVGIFVSLLFSGVFDALVLREPLGSLVEQVICAGVANVGVFLIVGLPAVWAYAKRNRGHIQSSPE